MSLYSIEVPSIIHINEINQNPYTIEIKGPLGNLPFSLGKTLFDLKTIKIKLTEKRLLIEPSDNVPKKFLNSIKQSILQKIKGVSQGYKYDLILKGLGYKLALHSNKKIIFKLGYSHEFHIKLPEDVKILIHNPTSFSLTGVDKQTITLFIDRLRKLKKVDPYKGKGIFLKNHKIKLKEGKNK